MELVCIEGGLEKGEGEIHFGVNLNEFPFSEEILRICLNYKVYFVSNLSKGLSVVQMRSISNLHLLKLLKEILVLSDHLLLHDDVLVKYSCTKNL